MNSWIVSIAVAYLLGSIPFGYVLVRVFRKEDIRRQGSGNIGATNVVRSGAKGLGFATLLLGGLDAAFVEGKGALTVVALPTVEAPLVLGGGGVPQEVTAKTTPMTIPAATTPRAAPARTAGKLIP